METEKELIKKFIKYLKQNGYPDESLLYDLKLNNCFIDLAIIDIQTKKIMALFEIVNHNKKINCVSYFSRLIKEFKEYDIPIYAVYNEKNENGFIVERIDVAQKYIENEVISFKNIQNSFTSIYFWKKEKEKTKIKDKLDFLCIIIGIVILILFILDITGIVSMTLNRIILLSIMIGFFVFPFLQSIKVLGVEIERKRNEESADSLNHKKGRI